MLGLPLTDLSLLFFFQQKFCSQEEHMHKRTKHTQLMGGGEKCLCSATADCTQLSTGCQYVG